MNTKDFYFNLPENLIAQTPLLDRTASKLLILDKDSGKITHTNFKSIIDEINSGDCLVINDTKVIAARLFGRRKNSGGKVEILLLKRIDKNKWEALVKPGRKAKVGEILDFGEGILTGEIVDIVDEGNRIIDFTFEGIFEEVLDQLGEMPLPPYITEKLEDKDRYQTVYATHDGSAAAPTAGLHFTDEILETLINKGVKITRVTLHVGLGTFRPVKVDNVLEHKMHSETYNVSEESAKVINETKKSGGRVICVGTTSCRTIESCADDNGQVVPGSGETDIFIYPGVKIKVMDGLITNFHLPESTLIMLVSAFSTKENVLNAYNVAVDNKYRFFSFGDAMFIR